MFRVRIQKLGSLLGLLAILMTALAPTVSQVLASQRQLSDGLATYCTAHPANAASHDDGDDDNHPATSHWQACAYCGLLAHVPAVTGGTAPLFVAQRVIRVSVRATPVEARAVRTYASAQPRAPPAFC
ncbi:MAG TPA: DUF2946 domain-containing protein [Paraburkholderia sp.]|jgi:hypothetical protein|nr:DUF2946 domain-containing protein [Paraburkholderia sp.]